MYNPGSPLHVPPHGLAPHGAPPRGPTQCRVVVVSAYNMPKKSGFRDITDPFVEIQLGGQKSRTSTKTDAGSEATFNEQLMFSYSGEPTMMVHLYDEDKKKADFLGSGKLDLTPDILRQGGFRGAIRCFDKKDRMQGEVLVHVHFI
eukprot:Protomagalhaensia_sp_Gyna_25__1673@NODE_1872_length_1458_cov_612_560958_g1540_i0_p2_GENE_NODE_1872_length_1458_cov_612_560958_g1540_i0NODE_1872_length_1458_cov_612_560958_g1540_i0_p2_ORF_typecomplete_len146_score23_15C2/PF00168_30/1_6e14_NODE_1872_length_1458_cov_612_560958_g1540_i09261363